jgi:PAS domain S-box-containing protein
MDALRSSKRPDMVRLFDALPWPLLIVSRDFVMVAANDAYFRNARLTPDRVLGKPLFETFPDNPDDPDATGVANLRASLTRVLSTGLADEMPIQRYDVERTAEEGGGFEERYWLPFNSPILGEEGDVEWILHRAEDVTEVVREGAAAESVAANQRSTIADLKTANDALAREVRQRAAAQQALRDSEAWLKLLLNSAAEGVYAVDRDGVTILCNSAFFSMLGIDNEADALGHKLHDVIHHTRPDGSTYPRAECPIYRTAQTGEPAHVVGESFIRLDGSAFPVEYWVRPIIKDGELQGAVCTFNDVTERQRAQERQEILVRELDHRVKNLFSIVTAIVGLSSRSAGSVRELADDIKGRVLALAAAHELARPSGDTASGSTTVNDLANKVLAPHINAEERVLISGPPVHISAAQASGLALVLHELATNAVKYGAFSNDSGTVRLSWLRSADLLSLEWVETGGPQITGPPARKGFGTILANRTATSTLRGRITHDWKSQGLSVRLSMPLIS